MNKAALYLFLLLVLPTTLLFAQHPQRCHSDEKTELLKDIDPEYYRSLQNPIPSNPSTPGFLLPDVVTIPVHVIIVHPPGQAVGTGVNFSMDHILSQIDVLNEDFRRLNTDASNTPDVFDAADSEIEFCMASIDPDGNDTDGVTRYGTNQNLNNNEAAIKNATRWDRNNYLNIWVGSGLGNLLGWAYLPTLGGLPSATLDGVVIASGTFGGPGYGTTNNYDLGRTCTHEVGHYLGLRHVWGNGGCGNDDGFVDTPTQSGSNFGCPNHPSTSCGNSGDMFMNYMDYVNDDCMNAFTEDQNAYMHQILNSSRSSLLSAANTYCNNSGGAPLFVELVSQTDALCFGESSGTVTVLASGGSGGYTYAIDGGAFQTSNVFTDLAAGLHTVSAMDSEGAVIDIEVTISQAPELFSSIDAQIDVTCFGLEDGTLIVSAFGGTPGYQYSIDGGVFSPSSIFENLSAGSHFITVQDMNGCEVETTTFIQEPAELITLPDEITNVTCNGNGDGLIAVVTVGGNPNYSYTLDQINFQPNPVFFNLEAGDYQMTTLDQNGCVEETIFSISEPEVLELNVIAQNDVLCFGEENGNITLEAVGGTAGYEYSIDNINYQATPVFDNLAPGTYYISVLDANQCYSEIETNINGPEALVFDLVDQTGAGCAGQSEGSLTLSALGGAGGNIFVYQTDTLTGDTVTFSDLPSGTHTVSVYDINDCSSELVVDIEANGEIVLDTINYENISCFQNNDGLIEVQGTGGSGSYQYALNGGSYGNENIFTDLEPGDYTVNVIDDAGCEGAVFFNLTAPDEITTSIENIINPNCFGESNGTIEVVANGGSGTFEYILGAETNLTGIFTSLNAGVHEVIAIDANDCSELIEVNVLEPELLSASIDYVIDVNCAGDASGAIQVEGLGGTGNITYTLNTESNSSGLFESLIEGDYTINAVDENGCSTSINAIVESSDDLEIAAEDQSPVVCFGEANGFIQLTVSGGNGNFEYTLDSETNNTGLFENLNSGTYSAIVTDGSSCSGTYDFEITEPLELETIIESETNITCFGESNGSLVLSAMGGTEPYIFDNGISTNTDGVFENLDVGNYDIIVTDNSGCSVMISSNIEEAAEIEAVVSDVQNVGCNGQDNGSFIILGSGGSGNLEYTANGITNNTGVFENLAAGSYPVMIADENDCQIMISAEILETSTIELEVTEVVMNNCFGISEGSIQAEASGGEGDFEYTLGSETNTDGLFENLPAGDYEVMVVDANGCSNTIEQSISEPTELEITITDIQAVNCFGNAEGAVQLMADGGSGNFEFILGAETNSNGLFENLPAGIYEVMVVDENDCSMLQNFTIDQPAELETEIIDLQNIECNGMGTGSVEVLASGGNSGYQFTLGTETNNTGVFTDLPAGDYEIQIVDANACQAIETFDIVEAANLEVDIITVQAVQCFGESTAAIQVNAVGGSGNYDFELNGEINTTGYFENLEGGAIEVSILDQNGCSDILQYEITQPQAIEPVIIASETPLCFGDLGLVTIAGTGGNGNFQYAMNGETNNTGIFGDLPAGDYNLLIIDGLGCSSESNISITAPDALEGTIIENVANNCFDGNDGLVQLDALGGSGLYSYTLGIENNNTGIFSNLPAGNYEVTIEDENGCTDLISFSISQPDQIASEIIEIQNIDCSDPSGLGFVSVQAIGGNGSYEYTLNGSTNSTGLFENLASGNYEIQITDGNNCSGFQSFSIIEGANLNVTIDLVEEIDCYNDTNGSVQVSAEGGTGSYQFELDGETNNTGFFENLSSGYHDVTVIDADGCESTIEYLINQPEEIVIDNLEPINASCFGQSDGSLGILVEGGNGDYTFDLNGQINSDGFFENLEANTYLLIVTDGNACSTSTFVTIEEPINITAEVIENVSVSCYGQEDGILQVSGLGGNGNISYTLGLETNTTGAFENLPGGIYTVMLTDDNGCSGSIETTIIQPDEMVTEILDLQSIGCSGNLFGSIQVVAIGGTGTIEYTLGSETNTTGVFENLNAGDYTMEIFDANNCNSFIEFSIFQSGDLEAEVLANTSATCFNESDGMVQIVANGNGNYSYTLGTGTNEDGIFTGLAAGSYTVFVSDGAGCNTSVDFTIDQPNAIIGEAIELSPLTCFGESDAVIQIEAFGGNGPYVFTLNNETNTSGGFENLSAGSYEALIVDQNNCTTIVDVFIIEPDAIQSDIIQNVEPACFGMEDGMIQIQAFGGTAPYTYTLGAETNTTGAFENLPAGNYQVLISDDNECFSSETIILHQPEALLSGVLDITPVQCNGASDGILFMGASGGEAPYQFELDGEINNGGVFFNLPAGVHTVNVTDANDCISQSVVIISEPNVLILEAVNLQDDTGSGNGSVSLQTQGGIGPFQYSLDGITYVTPSTFSDLAAGDYIAYVRDSNGCISEVSFTIEIGTFITHTGQGLDEIQLFPNPFSDDLNLELSLSEGQEIEIRMFTIHGQELFVFKKYFGQGQNNSILDIPNQIATGAYIFSIRNTNGQLGYFKLIKQ